MNPAATTRSAAQFAATQTRRLRLRPWARALAIGLIALSTAACGIIEDVLGSVHSLRVVNLCGGANTNVNVYLNGVSVGTVYYSAVFPIFSGPLLLRAEGTGPGGTVFTDSTYVEGNLTWTLCPSHGRGMATAAGMVGEQEVEGLLSEGIEEEVRPAGKRMSTLP